MVSDSSSPMLIVLGLVWVLIGVGILVWYLWAMSRLFPKIGLKSGEGWIPVWNQWKLLERAGLPGWVVVLSFVGLSIVPAIMLIIAMHRINKEFGAGGGYTVLGVFIAPLWAMLLANFIDERTAVSGPTRQPQVAPVFNTQAHRGFAPGTQPASSPNFASQIAPQQPAPAAAQAQSSVPTMFQAQGSGFAPQQPQPHAPQPPQPGFAPQAQQSPNAPQPWNPAAAAPAAPAVPAAPAPYMQQGPLGGETEADYDRLAAESFYASPAVPLGQNQAPSPFSWTAASQAAREQAEPEREPVIPPVHPLAAAAPAVPLPPAPAAVVAPAAPQVQAVPAAPMAPVAPVPVPEVAQSIPATMPVQLPGVAAAPVAPVAPAAAQESAAAASPAPAADESFFAPLAPVHASPTPAVQIPTGITGKVDPLPPGEVYAAATRAASTRQAIREEDDLDRTVVVPRASTPAWVLELPDGTELPLQGDVTVGRRPESVDGSEILAIPDTTRTLSKSHARLSFVEGRWLVEDLGSTNGLVLMNEDGSESELVPGVQAAATERMLFGTLEVRLRPRGESA